MDRYPDNGTDRGSGCAISMMVMFIAGLLVGCAVGSWM